MVKAAGARTRGDHKELCPPLCRHKVPVEQVPEPHPQQDARSYRGDRLADGERVEVDGPPALRRPRARDREARQQRRHEERRKDEGPHIVAHKPRQTLPKQDKLVVFVDSVCGRASPLPQHPASHASDAAASVVQARSGELADALANSVGQASAVERRSCVTDGVTHGRERAMEERLRRAHRRGWAARRAAPPDKGSFFFRLYYNTERLMATLFLCLQISMAAVRERVCCSQWRATPPTSCSFSTARSSILVNLSIYPRRLTPTKCSRHQQAKTSRVSWLCDSDSSSLPQSLAQSRTQ